MKAIVTGMIATFPVAGVAWDYGQYALGLERLGFEVYYLEDSGIGRYTLNPQTGEYELYQAHGIRVLQHALSTLSPTLGQRWHVRTVDDTTFGLSTEEIAAVAADADLFLNVSGCCLLRDEYRRARHKVMIDTDPGWNHFVIFPRWDRKPRAEQCMGWRAHDHFFTYALRLGQPDCSLPTFGIDWQPTVPPVVLDWWEARGPAERWTTVTSWNTFQEFIGDDTIMYGSKEPEFEKIVALPSRSPASFEVAVSGEPPVERWRALGWSVIDAGSVSRTVDAYRAYIEASRGEFSVAKNAYVVTRCGWFSCRSTCYLAAGLPVVVQDTGFGDVIPTGQGVLSFRTLDDAVAAIDTVEDRQAARDLARDYFAAEVVLGELLEHVSL